MQTIRVFWLGLLILPALGFAQSAFEGTWRPDPQRPDHPGEPQTTRLARGEYECSSCKPPYKIKADGHDQALKGNPYYDTLSIAVMDDNTLTKTGKKDGKVTLDAKVTVSADGATKTEVQRQIGGTPFPMELTIKYARVGASAAGSHAVSGSWQMTEVDVTNHAEDTTFKLRGGALVMTDRLGRSFTAKFDGTPASYKGSDEFNGVSLKLIDERTIEESDLLDGKVVKISRWSISPDGQTMHARFDDTHGHIQEQDGHKVK
jgi:hypothetical protein